MLDFNNVTRNCGGDATLATELAQVFLEEYPAYLQALDQAMAKRSSEDMRFAAHRLRGALGIFDAGAAMEAAAYLENLGLTSQLAKAPDAIDTLKNELRLVEEEIRILLRAARRYAGVAVDPARCGIAE